MRCVLAFLAIVGFLAPSVHGDAIPADADTYIQYRYADGPDQNKVFGGLSEVKTGAESYWKGKAYLHFDLSGVTGPVQSATLDLTGVTGPSASQFVPNTTRPLPNLYIYALLDDAADWDPSVVPESGAGAMTWNSGSPANDVSSNGFLDVGSSVVELAAVQLTAGVNASVSADITDVVNWVLGQNPGFTSYVDSDDDLTIGMTVSTNHNDWNNSWQWLSREHTPGDDSDAPRVTLGIPEPASMALLGIGGLVVLIRRRK